MNTTDLRKTVASRTGYDIGIVKAVLDEACLVIGDAVAGGDSVWLREFGKFERRGRREVVRRNPKTGAPIPVPEKSSIGFVASPLLKARLNDAPKPTKKKK